MTILTDMTLYLSVTSMLILIFKKAFKNKLSARWQVWIWALLLIRMFIPSLPQSEISVYNAVPMQESRYIQQDETTVNNLNTTVSPYQDHIQDLSADKKFISADSVIVTVWLTGTGLLMIYFLSVYILHLSKLKNYTTVKNSSILNECIQKLKIQRHVDIISGGRSPMLFGIIKPKILLPEGFSDDEKKKIITHELCHMKHNDILITWFAVLVLCFNWFNPIIWYSFFVLRRDIEVYCDERVLKYTDNKKDYASLLVKTALNKNRFIAGTTSLQNGEKEIERRVKHMAYFKKPSFIWTAVILIVLLGISAIALTNSTVDCRMTDAKYEEFKTRMVGSVMAELDYADNEKIVFHYIDSLFVYSHKDKTIEQKIDISKLNCSPHQQGSHGLMVTVSNDGTEALLENYGVEDEIKNFDNYIVNLKTGKAKTTSKNIPEKDAFLSLGNSGETYKMISDAEGWVSDISILLEGGEKVYLTIKNSVMGYLLFCKKLPDGTTESTYIFNELLNNTPYFEPKEITEITAATLECSGQTYTLTDSVSLKRLEKMLNSAAPMKGKSACPFTAILYLTRADGVTGKVVLAADSCAVYETSGQYYDYSKNDNSELLLMFDLIQFPYPERDNSLYAKTSEYLLKEFKRVYTPHYEIIDLEISNWQENGSEATFFYTMTFKNYDNDPDTVPYIKEAKENGNKHYKTYYKEYLEQKEGNYEFKIADNGGELELYSNVSPKGQKWELTKVDDFIMKHE